MYLIAFINRKIKIFYIVIFYNRARCYLMEKSINIAFKFYWNCGILDEKIDGFKEKIYLKFIVNTDADTIFYVK